MTTTGRRTWRVSLLSAALGLASGLPSSAQAPQVATIIYEPSGKITQIPDVITNVGEDDTIVWTLINQHPDKTVTIELARWRKKSDDKHGRQECFKVPATPVPANGSAKAEFVVTSDCFQPGTAKRSKARFQYDIVGTIGTASGKEVHELDPELEIEKKR